MTGAHCALLSLTSILHKPCFSGRLSKLKNIRLLSENISLPITTPRIMRVERKREIGEGWEREGQEFLCRKGEENFF